MEVKITVMRGDYEEVESASSESSSEESDASVEEFTLSRRKRERPRGKRRKTRVAERTKSRAHSKSKGGSKRESRAAKRNDSHEVSAIRQAPLSLGGLYGFLNQSIKNPYATCDPCKVSLHRLTPDFIDDAINGRIKWSLLRQKGTKKVVDWEGYIRRKMNSEAESVNRTINGSSDTVGTIEDMESNRRTTRRKRKADESYTESFDAEDSCNEEYQIERVSTRRSTKRSAVSEHKCKDCSFTTDEPEVLLLHTGLHKNVCNDCNMNFENKFKYQKHVYEVHKPPVELKNHVVFGCKICKEYFDQEGDAQLHISSHMDATEDGKYACMMCKSTFTREFSLSNHLIAKHLSYKCTFCDFLGASLDLLERHSIHTHAAYGKPYPCDLCDFRSSTVGALFLHRKTNHGLEREGDHERCRICTYLLISDREVILEHLAGHTNFTLFECQHCENIKTNSYNAIRDHGVNFHATNDIPSFAKVHDTSEMMRTLKKTIHHRLDVKPAKKKKRGRPTFTETKDAIAGIYSPEVSSTFDSILDSSPNGKIYMGTSQNSGYFSPEYQISAPVPPDAMDELPDSSCDPNFGLFGPDEELMESSQAYHQDPLSIAMQSVNCNGIVNTAETVARPSEGVLSVDPTTGQLFLQGLPVLDEQGNPVLVQMQSFSQPRQNAPNPNVVSGPPEESNNLSANGFLSTETNAL